MVFGQKPETGCIDFITVPVGLSNMPIFSCDKALYKLFIKSFCIGYGSKGNPNESEVVLMLIK